ncbi:Mitochondrial ribosomal protein S25 [Ceraceosorus bombacis]|uniref:Small ribosomal subunit protein mS23 n=1 Tax=Ceraceosorus bombacis TaxID=401625 RepID=A0A0P1BF71_9BASI|nr:Mitochondrial ribosomal protein S25 [Ceraceosorus bombacis]
MPRRLATALPSTLARLQQGNMLKSVPRILPVLAEIPPLLLGPRAPSARPTDELSPEQRADTSATTQSQSRALSKSKKKYPSLSPQKIVYLGDKVRRTFFKDHPWELKHPRMLVEGRESRAARDPTVPGQPVDLSLWGNYPTAEDVISCVLLQHKREGISLSAAYHHTLSSFYSLRARAEHSRRSAVAEALAYGATFPIKYGKSEYQAGGAREILRFTLREGREIKSGAAFLNPDIIPAAPGTTTGAGASATGGQTTERRANARLDSWTGGTAYLQASRAARDEARRIKETTLSPSSVQSAQETLDGQGSDDAISTPAMREAAQQIEPQLSSVLETKRAMGEQSVRTADEAAQEINEEAAFSHAVQRPFRASPRGGEED